MDLKLEHITRAQCCRCGYVSEVEATAENLDTPLINKAHLYPLNYKGDDIKEIADAKYYFCADCWNDLLDFFQRA